MIWRLPVFLYFALWVDADHNTCSTCIGYRIEHIAGKSTLEKKYLKGYSLSSSYVPDIESCFTSCIYYDCKCVSMNYKMTEGENGTHLCELNYETKSSENDSRLISKAGYFHIDIIPTRASETEECPVCKTGCCTPNPCLNGGICLETCKDARRFQCNCTNGHSGRFCQKGSDLLFSGGKITDYAVVRKLTTELSEFTLSLWMKSSDGTHPDACIFSYATTSAGHNTIGVMSIGKGLYLQVLSAHTYTTIKLNDGIWHHLVITWENKHGKYNIYKDGTLSASGSYTALVGSVVPANGTLILGQDQDSVGGGFGESQSYIGLISDLQLCDRVLLPQEIGHFCYSGNRGNILSWSKKMIDTIKGDVSFIGPTSCP